MQAKTNCPERFFKLYFFTLIALVTVCTNALAEDFFQNCKDVLNKPEFKVLQRYLQTRKDFPKPNECFRLNNSQFLMTVRGIGRIAQGLYYYDAKANTFGLSDGHAMPLASVVLEFLGPNKKRFVLLSVSNLQHGNWDRGYSILNLIPVVQGGKPYIHYNILSWNEDPEHGLCGHWTSTSKKTGETVLHKNISSGTTQSINAPEVIEGGTNNVELAFPVTEQNCETSEIKKYKKIFRLEDGIFLECTE